MLDMAFKEWAVIVEALGAGRQALILRKGGIAEEAGEFRPEHPRFWLYPTWLHQQAGGLKPEAGPLPPSPVGGAIPLTFVAEVEGVYDVRSESAALRLDDLHLWSDETVRQRFAYRRPGLYVLPVRVYRTASPHTIIETPAYAGCKSWVHLSAALPTEDLVPVIDDATFRAFHQDLERRLNPTALV